MNSSTIRRLIVLTIAFVAPLSSPAQIFGQVKKIQVDVYVLNDQAKDVPDVKVHIVPVGLPDVPTQFTTGKGCLQFQFDTTTSFDIAFWYKGQLVGVLRGMAGFENQIVRVNHARLSLENKENAILKLAGIRYYTATLSARETVQPDVVLMLKEKPFQDQLTAISGNLKSTTTGATRAEIVGNINKLKAK